MSQPPRIVDPQQKLEIQIRELLKRSKSKRALDELRPHYQKDRERWQLLMGEVILKYIEQMIGGGNYMDARKQLELAGDSLTAPVRFMLEMRLLKLTGQTEERLRLITEALVGNGPAFSPANRAMLADDLVMAFAPLPGESAVAAELTAIFKAMELVCREQPAEAGEALKSLPRQSAFSHWRLFLKGLIAWHQGDREKAATAFEALPKNTVPTRAAAVYLWLSEKRGVPPPEENTFATLGPLLDSPPALAKALPEIQQNWERRRYGAVYTGLKRTLPEFPTDEATLAGDLTDLSLSVLFTSDTKEADDFWYHINEQESRDKKPGGREKMLFQRVLVLTGNWDDRKDYPKLTTAWEQFIAVWQQLHGRNDRFASIAWEWFGEQMAKPHREEEETRRSLFFSEREDKPRQRDVKRAKQAYQLAIRHDPSRTKPLLALVELLERIGDASARNILLDEAVGNHPEDAGILRLAGKLAIDRHAFVKGLDYLEQAWERDKLNPETPGLILKGLTGQAKALFDKAKPEAARESLDRATRCLAEIPGDFMRQTWHFLAWRGVLELTFGDVGLGRETLDRALRTAPFPSLYGLHLLLISRQYPRHQAELEREWKAVERTGEPPTLSKASEMIRFYIYSEKQHKSGRTEYLDPSFLKWLMRALRVKSSRVEAAQFLEMITDHPHFRPHYATFVKSLLDMFLNDPLFKLYETRFSLAFPYDLQPSEVDRVDRLLREAETAGDELAGELGRRIMGELRAHGWEPPSDRRASSAKGREGDDFEAMVGRAYADEEEDDQADGDAPWNSEADFAAIMDGEVRPSDEMVVLMIETIMREAVPEARRDFELFLEEVTGKTGKEVVARATRAEIPPGLAMMFLRYSQLKMEHPSQAKKKTNPKQRK